MKKTIFIIFVIIFQQNILYTPLNANNNYYNNDERKLTSEKVIKDVNEIKSKMDTALMTGKEIIDILSTSTKENGLKKTIQIYNNIFIPMFIFGILFLLYLRKRKKQ